MDTFDLFAGFPGLGVEIDAVRIGEGTFVGEPAGGDGVGGSHQGDAAVEHVAGQTVDIDTGHGFADVKHPHDGSRGDLFQHGAALLAGLAQGCTARLGSVDDGKTFILSGIGAPGQVPGIHGYLVTADGNQRPGNPQILQFGLEHMAAVIHVIQQTVRRDGIPGSRGGRGCGFGRRLLCRAGLAGGFRRGGAGGSLVLGIAAVCFRSPGVLGISCLRIRIFSIREGVVHFICQIL